MPHLALQADDIALRGAVLLDVLLSALEDLLALGLAQLFERKGVKRWKWSE